MFHGSLCAPCAGTINWNVDALSQLHALAAKLDINGLMDMLTAGTGTLTMDTGHLGFKFDIPDMQTHAILAHMTVNISRVVISGLKNFESHPDLL